MLWGRFRSAAGRLGGYGVFWLKALRQPTIDLTIRTHTGLITRIVETPGLSLSEAELGELVSQLRAVAAKTLPEESLTYGIFSGERERLSRAIVTLICEEATGRPIAFNALSVMEVVLDGEPVEVTHLGLVMVDPDERDGGRRILYGLTACSSPVTGCVRNGSRTSPRCRQWSAWSARPFRMSFRRRTRTTPELCASAVGARHHVPSPRRVRRGCGSGFDEARFVITNAYTGGSDALKKTFEVAPKHRDEQYTRFAPVSWTTPGRRRPAARPH